MPTAVIQPIDTPLAANALLLRRARSHFELLAIMPNCWISPIASAALIPGLLDESWLSPDPGMALPVIHGLVIWIVWLLSLRARRSPTGWFQAIRTCGMFARRGARRACPLIRSPHMPPKAGKPRLSFIQFQ